MEDVPWWHLEVICRWSLNYKGLGAGICFNLSLRYNARISCYCNGPNILWTGSWTSWLGLAVDSHKACMMGRTWVGRACIAHLAIIFAYRSNMDQTEGHKSYPLRMIQLGTAMAKGSGAKVSSSDHPMSIQIILTNIWVWWFWFGLIGLSHPTPTRLNLYKVDGHETPPAHTSGYPQHTR